MSGAALPRTLYLHVGLPKTGTTAIQEFLSINRALLKARGVLYPQTGIERYSHHQFQWMMKGDERRDVALESGSMRMSLQREIESSDCKVTVISSEGFFFGVSPERLLEYFGPLFDEIRIVIYLRQPYRWILSDYNQGVKGWRGLTYTFEDHLRKVLAFPKCPMNFYLRISGFAAVFGWQNIVIRSFDSEKNDLPGGFLKIVGLDNSDSWRLPERLDSNPALPLERLELFRVINTMNLPQKQRRQLLDMIGEIEISDLPAFKMSFRWPRKLSSTFKKTLKEIDSNNKKLLEHFDRQFFGVDFFSLSKSAKMREYRAQRNIDELVDLLGPYADSIVRKMNWVIE